MRVGVDQAGEEGHSRKFDNAGVLRRLCVGRGSGLLDLPAADQDDPALVGRSLSAVEDASRLEQRRLRDRIGPKGQKGGAEERLHGRLGGAGTLSRTRSVRATVVRTLRVRGSVPATIVTPPTGTAGGTELPSTAPTRFPWSPRGARGRPRRTTGRDPSRRCTPRRGRCRAWC